jgi:Zn-dependent protease
VGVDDKELLLILLAAAGLWLGIMGSRVVVVLLQLRRMRFSPAQAAVVERDGMPAEVAALLDPVGEALTGLGFHYEKTLRAPSMLRNGEPPDSWQDIYRHAGNGCRANLRCSESPEPGLLVAVIFTSVSNGQTLRTENRIVHLELPPPPELHVEDALADSLEAQWQYHCGRLPEGGADALPADGDDDLDISRRFIEYWQESGIMVRAGEFWLPGWNAAWRVFRTMLAGSRRVAALSPMARVESVELRQLADQRAWAHHERMAVELGMPRRGKLLAFLVSLGLGVAAFAWLDSLRFALILLAILLVHEFGHALAMRVFGYRQMSVLVLPFLGAVAIGRKDDAGPWQKMAILLAGPLPGLLAGALCLRLALVYPDQHTWLTEVGGILLGLNLFNLLPISPLDGGQILDTFLFARRPRLRVGFHLISALALVLLGYSLNSTILAGLGLILMAALPFAWRRVGLLRGLAGASDGDTAVAAILHRLHAAPGPKWPSFGMRIQIVRMLLPWLRGRPPKWTESLAGVVIYLLVLASPVLILWDTPLPTRLWYWANQQVFRLTYSPPDWSAQLVRAKTPEARWQVLYEAGQWYQENYRDEEAKASFRDALAEAEKLPKGGSGHLHRLDTRIALARLAEQAESREQYQALLPELRALPFPEQERLANVLEALSWQESKRPVHRVPLLREAIAVRERLPDGEKYSLRDDRLELARLLDADGDAGEAERLLRANLGQEWDEYSAWQMEPYAWLLLAHGRPEEAKNWLEKVSTAEKSSSRLPEALPWAYLALQRPDEARVLFERQLAAVDPRHWQPERARLEIMLDLVHASAGHADIEERWLAEAQKAKEKLGKEFRGVRRSVRYEAEGGQWESLRGKARLAVLDRLPGADEERRQEDADRYSCKQ